MAEAARRAGVEALVVAAESAAEAGLGGGIEIIAARDLRHAVEILCGPGRAGARARAAGVGGARPAPTWRRCADSRAPGGRSRSPRPGATTCS